MLFKKKVKNIGKPDYRLTIKIECCQKNFKDHPAMTATDQIEKYGCVIRLARQLLGGEWLITEKGFLVRLNDLEFYGDLNVLPKKEAAIQVDHLNNLTGVLVLEKCMKQGLDELTGVHCHYVNGGLYNFRFHPGEKLFYFDELAADYESDILLNKA